ncbi:phosphoglucosamine mutase [Phaeobacter gallaeciensis]|uniref:Phosphoglucosamine mutase n=1 Tax=Phaeobacter gallaeciensis TaxID=60890 RepID=A0ABD4XDJ7_9RHOB|nr:phosphoglucosamine mutase [Phaeobacter gallaeciensis]MDE4146526.1 phosphoglucosamine mutase [Phaeobacter gallaeciensis]MDE4159110.1 phosphoglucosamine mutase [Phaeobacter gallaeciensis]MDE4163287.1 phosphoglucosamine mutase [Phaeobacter gallaeciensis]MDE4167606.1 phosphoglucosamine mutase [Phaeobacter gallaeciensis]MDE4171840.1 phosphoglucosamine mutase [Phaeobacter gallaeciensis]
MRKLFGTDGVRGTANTHPMTADMALRIGAAVGRYFRREAGGVHRVVIGKDTRLSGYMFENALTAGLTSTGMNVLLLGPVPTPAVGLMTRSMRADLGVMISASHNPAEDNGIKFFGPDGFKLSDQAEIEIEALIEAGVKPAQAGNIGRAKRIDDARFRYGERVKSSLPRDIRLDGLKVVVDCANGAAHRAAPEILWELGAEVIAMGTSPDGTNINRGCGSTQPQAAAEMVVAHGAHVGICLDGDADRVIVIDENGAIADGDQLMALLAARWSEAGRLAGGALVATVMSNLGLERFLQDRGLRLERTAVGDRYVVEAMRAGGFNLGGEQSGHIVMSDYATTGDGLMAGLHVLAAMVQTGQAASQLVRQFDPVPQLLKNVRFGAGQTPLEETGVQDAIRDAEAALMGQGRLLIRKSGTEPLIRVMAECEDDALLMRTVDQVVEAVEAASA